MIRLAEFLPTEQSRLWSLCKQMDVNYAVTGLPKERNGMVPWDFANLVQMKKGFEDFDIDLQVIESMPPSNKIKLGLPGRDEEIDVFCELITNMGAADIPVLCYNFMAQFGWFRTSTTIRTRGGALVSGYDHSLMRKAPLTPAGIVSEEQLWENLKYFLERIVPVAEKAGVKLAMHPDDPPISPIRGVSRILVNADALQRMMDLVPSEVNGITLCQGVLSTACEDIPALIRRFSKQNKIFFVHFRDVQGTPEKFEETFHDDGKTNMIDCLKAYEEAGYDGPMRPDHVPTMAGENNDHPGYEVMGRLYGIGYIKGLMKALAATE